MSDVKRYKHIGGSMYLDDTMHDNGVIRWTRASDYDALAAENAQLRYDLEKMTASRNEYYECYVAQRAKVMRLTDQPSVQPSGERT